MFEAILPITAGWFPASRTRARSQMSQFGARDVGARPTA
jgi:hypothetical protein